MNKTALIVSLIAAVAVFGVWFWNRAADATPFSLNTTRQLSLQPGETDRAFGLTVAFNRVIEDSRCPANANCIQAGRFVGEFIFTSRKNPAAIHRLSYASATSSTISVQGYRIAISEVAPETLFADDPPQPSDYTVNLIIRRNP